jgi:hypothetical protein
MNPSHINASRSAAPALAVLLCSLGLAACGGSSAGTTTNRATTSPTNPAGGAGAAVPNAGRAATLRECLKRQGMTLPKPSAGGGQLPKGVTRAQFEAALKNCGAGALGRQGLLESNTGRIQALTKFAACMRSNGVNLPPPDTSGKGAIFNTRGLDTASAQFRTARMKCASLLSGLFGIGRPSAP